MGTRIGHDYEISTLETLRVPLLWFTSPNRLSLFSSRISKRDEFDIYSGKLSLNFLSSFFRKDFRKKIARFSGIIDVCVCIYTCTFVCCSGNYSGPRVSWQLMICN